MSDLLDIPTSDSYRHVAGARGFVAPRSQLHKILRTDRLTKWHVVVALVMATLGVAATFDAWHDIYTLATKDEEYSHIFLVPFVALGMIWYRRMRMRHCKPSGAFIGVALVFVGWMMFRYGFYHAKQ